MLRKIIKDNIGVNGQSLTNCAKYNNERERERERASRGEIFSLKNWAKRVEKRGEQWGFRKLRLR